MKYLPVRTQQHMFQSIVAILVYRLDDWIGTKPFCPNLHHAWWKFPSGQMVVWSAEAATCHCELNEMSAFSVVSSSDQWAAGVSRSKLLFSHCVSVWVKGPHFCHWIPGTDAAAGPQTRTTQTYLCTALWQIILCPPSCGIPSIFTSVQHWNWYRRIYLLYLPRSCSRLL